MLPLIRILPSQYVNEILYLNPHSIYALGHCLTLDVGMQSSELTSQTFQLWGSLAAAGEIGSVFGGVVPGYNFMHLLISGALFYQ